MIIKETAIEIVDQMSDDDRAGFTACEWREGLGIHWPDLDTDALIAAIFTELI